jgi:hypothetical protein
LEESNMNHRLWTATGARVMAMMFIVAGVTACGDRISDTRAKAPGNNPVSPSAQVIGQAPAEPQAASGNTAQTTAPAGAQSDVGKVAESTQRPIEGDNHSYSTLAPTTPQKADGQNTTGAGPNEGRKQ